MLDIIEDISPNPTKPEPLSETEVVNWLQTRIEADGEIATTTRDLEFRWSWDKNKISRFLDRLDGTRFHIERDKSGTRIGLLPAVSQAETPTESEKDSATAESDSGREFSWTDARKDGDLVQFSTRAVCAYINMNNMIVIRSEQDWNDEDDTIIVIAPHNLRALVNHLIELGEQLKIEF